MDVITAPGEDHRTIHQLAEAVSNGDMAAVPPMCDALLRTGALEDHLVIKRLVAELSDETSMSPAYVSRVGTLMRLVSERLSEEQDNVYPRIAADADPALDGSPEARQDAGASSDGDGSWAESPLTQDPGIDRSVDAVIRRTQGV